MTSAPLVIKETFEHSEPSSLDSSKNLVSHTFTHAAQIVVETWQQAYSVQVDSGNNVQTIAIRAIEPKYRQAIAIESLTTRELEVLQLIVDGYRNPTIARKLYVSEGTVKTHVSGILKKLCVSDRTQAAIRAVDYNWYTCAAIWIVIPGALFS
jgi:DNA-binding NarL/FixJ family response regulator